MLSETPCHAPAPPTPRPFRQPNCSALRMAILPAWVDTHNVTAITRSLTSSVSDLQVVVMPQPPGKKQNTRASTAKPGLQALTGIILAVLFISQNEGSKKKKRRRTWAKQSVGLILPSQAGTRPETFFFSSRRRARKRRPNHRRGRATLLHDQSQR